MPEHVLATIEWTVYLFGIPLLLVSLACIAERIWQRIEED